MLSLQILMAGEDFGPSLREEREKRGITLDELASYTKVSKDLWVGLENNDFSRWPSGIFARAFVRDYARAIGLDADDVVNEFCRQFPIGDRRGGRIVEAQAELIGHRHEGTDAELLPAGRERRKPRPSANTNSPFRVIYAPRAVAAAVDLLCIAGLGLFGTSVFGAGFLSSVGVAALLYFPTSTVGTGATPGVRILQAVRHRAPSLFTSRRTVSA
ncbi:MAG TPA: helix-turn-helix transcriptional regulator [Vicinamibacterales bacterium]|nr:helix-turn-helix transcriptional regulator [Vicinamibacterales bacterium]